MATPKISIREIGQNLQAGLTVAVVALPLALAFGVGSGLGAQAGLVTAIIAGVLAGLFGGSNYQVSGPTGAMTVILIPIVAVYGPSAVLQVGLLAAGFLFLAAIFRLGSHIHRLPTSLIEGFTAGIALVIALQQVAFVLGVEVERSAHVWETVYLEVLSWTSEPNPWTLGLGMLILTVNLIAGHWFPKFPIAIVSIFLATVLVELLKLEVPLIGQLPSQLFVFSTDFLDLGGWLVLLAPGLAVGFLAGLESLLSAKIADRLTGKGHHLPNKELFGQGVANLVVPFFGGVPATAALARTAVNIRSGATRPLATISHGAFLLIFVLFLASTIELVPLFALGGVLIATAYHMIKPAELIKTAKASRLDGLVLVITLIATLLLDLISALLVGLAIYFFFRKTKLNTKTISLDPEQTLGD